MTPQIRSHIEYFIPTNSILVLIRLRSSLMKQLVAVTDFNTIYPWVSMVLVQSFCPPCTSGVQR